MLILLFLYQVDTEEETLKNHYRTVLIMKIIYKYISTTGSCQINLSDTNIAVNACCPVGNVGTIQINASIVGRRKYRYPMVCHRDRQVMDCPYHEAGIPVPG
jgi:hypothetical protein